MVGIAKTLEVIKDLGDLAVDGIGMVKGGFNYVKLIAMIPAVRELVADAPQALPELHEVDAAEAGLLGQAAYAQVVRVIKAAAA